MRILLLLICLVALSMEDLHSRTISNKWILILFIGWFITLKQEEIQSRWILARLFIMVSILLLGYLFSLAMKVVLGRRGIGGGDIKLFGLMGLYFGIEKTMYGMFLSGVLACMYSVYMTIKRKEYRKGLEIPFGPWISLAMMIMTIKGICY